MAGVDLRSPGTLIRLGLIALLITYFVFVIVLLVIGLSFVSDHTGPSNFVESFLDDDEEPEPEVKTIATYAVSTCAGLTMVIILSTIYATICNHASVLAVSSILFALGTVMKFSFAVGGTLMGTWLSVMIILLELAIAILAAILSYRIRNKQSALPGCIDQSLKET
ncbi:hypothetical protein HDE_01845 [Halotydeus destructor]|nr:hypothetical protein HDE_01845 [Halotydeus destructor]